jgi:hypothetical protein
MITHPIFTFFSKMEIQKKLSKKGQILFKKTQFLLDKIKSNFEKS